MSKRATSRALMAVMLLIATACGSQNGQGTSHGTAPAAAKDVFSLPAGFSLQGLQGDVAGTGVWVWAFGPGDTRVFHVLADGTSSSWSTGDPQKSGLVTGAQSGFTLDSHGMVWVGANQKLVRLSPTTSVVTSFDVPAVDSPAAERILAPRVQGSHAIVGLSSDIKGDHIAVALTATKAIEVLDTATGRFVQKVISDVGDPSDIAYGRDGTLAVGIRNASTGSEDTVELKSPTQPDDSPGRAAAAPSQFVTATGDGNFVTANLHIERLTPTGSASTPVRSSTYVLGKPAAGPAGQIAYPSNSGIEIVSSSDAVRSVELGTESCGLPTGRPDDAHPDTSSVCRVHARAIAIDQTGDLWYSTSTAPTHVFVMPAGSW